MCLSHEFATRQEALDKCPGDEFDVYKILKFNGHRLVSPAYTEKEWRAGTNLADLRSRGNGASGFYVFLAEPSIHSVITLSKVAEGWTHKNGGDRIIRFKCRREDVIVGGEDRWNGSKGTCLVVKRVELAKADYDNAKANRVDEYEIAIRKQVKKNVAAGRKVTTRKKVKAKKTSKIAKAAVAVTVSALRLTAKMLGLAGYSKMRKVDLECEIAKEQERNQAKSTAGRAKKKAVKKVVTDGQTRQAAVTAKVKKVAYLAKQEVARRKVDRVKWETYTRDELRRSAQKLGVVGYSRMNKVQLINALLKVK